MRFYCTLSGMPPRGCVAVALLQLIVSTARLSIRADGRVRWRHGYASGVRVCMRGFRPPRGWAGSFVTRICFRCACACGVVRLSRQIPHMLHIWCCCCFVASRSSCFLPTVHLDICVRMVFDVCEVCGRRHNPAHRCPIVRLNPVLWLEAPFSNRPVPVHELPQFDVECPYCCARFWRVESISCCGGGRLQLPLDQEVPDTLSEVILSAHVRANIRR